MKHGTKHGISLKKQYGQHFLSDQSVVDEMISHVNLTASSVIEIGCGDGFLTKSILKEAITRLWVFEIDSRWAEYVRKKYPDDRMTIFEEDILEVDFSIFDEFIPPGRAPWVLLSNLPYQITFVLFFKLTQYRHILTESVVMVQEEVAQKIIKTSGRGYGFNSLYLQHYFDFKLLKKVSPEAFYPRPKIFSRLLYFKPRQNLEKIEHEQEFWQFIKRCFASPRRNLKNNLKSFQYDLSKVPENILTLRAQQMNKQQLIDLWNILTIDKETRATV